MDVTLDVVLEQSKKVESTKRVQKMSDTSSQQLSSTSSKEKSLEVFSTLKSSNTGNVNNSSMASELNALNDSGKEIGEMVLQKPQQQSIMSSSSINTFGASSSSCLSLKQQTSSVSCTSYSSTKKKERMSSTATSKQILSSSKSLQSAEKVLMSSVDAIEYGVEDDEL